MRSLVADDEDTSRRVLEAMLLKHGPCTSVSDGALAVEEVEAALAQNNPFDLICLDILMPNLDGQEALKRIRELEADVELPQEKRARVFMITAVLEVDSVLSQISDWDAYVVKPFERGFLQNELERFALV